MDDDDRASAGSLEAAAGGSDVEALSGDSFLNDDPATAADLDAIAGTLSDGDDGGSGRRQLGRRDDSNQALYAQETFLADTMPRLHQLMHLDSGVHLRPLEACLISATNMYGYLIEHSLPETDPSAFAMYDAFFQPLIREALPAAMQQLTQDARQAALVTHANVAHIRRCCHLFIRLTCQVLTLHARTLGGAEMGAAREQPVMSQRVGDDVGALLRTLSDLLAPGALLHTPAFYSCMPHAAHGWDATGMGGWATDAAQVQAAAAAVAAAQAEEERREVDLTGDGPEAPEAVASQLAARTWQASFIDTFGHLGGWDVLLELLGQPERLADWLWAFLTPLATAAHAMLPARRAALQGPTGAVLRYIHAGLSAAPDLSALEGSIPLGAEVRLSRTLMLARQIIAAAASPEDAEAQVGPLQREHVLRLLRAPAFTRQLAGVRLLAELVKQSFQQAQALPQGVEALLAWLRQHSVVQAVLSSNLHQAQYAEQAQRVLGILLQHGALDEESIAFLWQLTEDATTFEAVKSNAYAILASLGPHMEQPQLDQLFARLKARAAASGVSEANSICSLLVGMATQDQQGLLAGGVLRCLADILLRPGVPAEVAGNGTLAELCTTYDYRVAPLGIFSLNAASLVRDQLTGESAAPAALVLHGLLSDVWHKPERLRAAMGRLNPEADLLKRCLHAYSSWLDWQRAAAAALAAAHGPAAVAEGPPAGGFSHRKAVDAWVALIPKVIHAGGWFLLQEQLEILLSWATTKAVTPYDADCAWRLLSKLVVGGRKEAMQEVADTFFQESLCQVAACHVSRAALRCVFAYMAALSEDKWATEVPEPVHPGNVWVTPERSNQDAARAFLRRALLDAPEPAVARDAGSRLAHVVAYQLGWHSRYDDSWRAELGAEVQRTLAELRQEALGAAAAPQEGPAGDPAGVAAASVTPWHAPPAAWAHLAAGDAGAHEAAAAARHCEGLLLYLTQLLEYCQDRRLTVPPPHGCCWKGVPLRLSVQLPAPQGQRPAKQELELPANLPVGCLRRKVAEWLARPPQLLRLLGGGRELGSDWRSLAACRAGQQLVMCSLSEKGNHYSGADPEAEASCATAARCLLTQPEVFPLALALAQAAPAVPAPQGEALAGEALRLLGEAPTCSQALAQLRALLLAPDAAQQLHALLAPQGAVQPAVLMYAAQCLCSLATPQLDLPALLPPEPEQPGAPSPEPEVLQRRLLLSGALGTLLELATQLAVPRQQQGAAAPAAAVELAAHGAVLLLLCNVHEALQAQEAAAAASVVAEAAAAAAAPLASGESASAMQVDSASPDNGSSAAGGAAAGAPPAGLAADRSPSVSMQAASADASDAEAAVAAAAGALPATSAAATARLEVDAAAAALAALAPATSRYILRMLCCVLRCHPGDHDGGAAGAAAASPTPGPPAAVYLSADELCDQALRLLHQLAQQSSAAVEAVTAGEAAAAEAVVRRLLLHPASSQAQRQLAADWLPRFAGAAPGAHRWAFERIVQPLLLEGGEGAGGGGDGGGAGAVQVGGAQEQTALCNHFIDTLDPAEFPAARQLLHTLLQRLSSAIARHAPIEGLAGVVGALVRRLDCREVGVTHGLVEQLIRGVCFPAIGAQAVRDQRLQALMAAETARLRAAGGGASTAQQQQQQQMQALGELLGRVTTAGPSSVAYPELEKCVAAARAHQVTGADRSSREAAFDLLLDLVAHDSGCWQQASAQLQNEVHTWAHKNLGPAPFNVLPLQALRPPGAFMGLQNGGATCYMSAVFQQLFMQPTIRQLILSAPLAPLAEQPDSVFHQVQAMFAHLALGVEPHYQPSGFWRAFKDYDGQPVNIREHQDSYEFFTRLQDSVDEHLRGLRRPRAIHAALGGTFAQLITPVDPQLAAAHRSERDEEFYQISLDVRGKRTLAESLDSYVSKELMDGQNQWLCEDLGRKVDAEKRTLIKALPHTLVLHLKRFEFDYETFQRWKVKDRFEFPLRLDMWPYTVQGAGAQGGAAPQQGEDPQARAGHRYELRGVVVHSGSAFAGHYYSYIKDRAPSGGWWCFDDTVVDAWDPSRLDKDCYGGRFVPEGFTQDCDRPNSAYMLFYEREGEEAGEQLLATVTAACAAADASQAAEAAAAAAGASAGAAPATAAAGEDTPMPTPQTAAPAAAPAAAATSSAGEAQPMAVSPAPEAQGASAEAAAAADQQLGAQQAGSQQQLQAQQAQQAAALPYGMPAMLFEAVLQSNLRHLSTIQLFSPEYSRFMWRLTEHLQDGVKAGNARKSAKREPTSSPGMDAAGGGSGSGLSGMAGGDCQLAALTSRRGGDLQAVIADVVLLLVDYFLRVALRSGVEVRRDVLGSKGRRPAPGMQTAVRDAVDRTPAAAGAVLLHMASGPASQWADSLLGLHTYFTVRDCVAELAKLAADCLSRQERRTEEAVHAVRLYIDHLCGTTVPQYLQAGVPYHFDPLLGLLARLASVKYAWRRALMDQHLTPLLALARQAVDEWCRLDSITRSTLTFGTSTLAMLGSLLRRFQLPDAPQGASRRKPQAGGERAARAVHPRNPYGLEGCEAVPAPAEVLDWLYAEPGFLRKLLLPSCVGSASFRLFAFLQWEDRAHARDWQRAMLEHVLVDASDWQDLAPELVALSQLLCMKDSLQEERAITFFEGMEGLPGLFEETFSPRRGKGTQHLLLALALSVLCEMPEALVTHLLARRQRWLDDTDSFLRRRAQDRPSTGDDDELSPDSPSPEELLSEAHGLEEMADVMAMWRRLDELDRQQRGAPSPSTSSGRGSPSASDASDGDGGGGGGAPGGSGGAPRRGLQGYGAAGAGAGAGDDWRQGLQGYGDDDSPRGSLQQHDASGGFIRGGQAEGHELPQARVGAARRPLRPLSPPQQHISAELAGGAEEEEVIEIEIPDASTP